MTRVKIEYPEKTIYSLETRIRISDLSAAHHLGFDSLVGILNDASAAFFKENGIVRGSRQGAGVIYTDLSVNYLGEAFYGETLEIEISAGPLGSKGFDLFFRVSRTEEKKIVAVAQIGVLFFDYQSRRPTDIPAEFRLKMKKLWKAVDGKPNEREGSPSH